MDKRIGTWLIDIQNAIEEIFGEAMNRILKVDSNFSISNSRRIVDTRNRVSHGYDSVSESIIWAIVIKELPKLLIEVQAHLRK